jgi:hypothetical protein
MSPSDVVVGYGDGKANLERFSGRSGKINASEGP